MKRLNFDTDAPWKERFRASRVICFELAANQNDHAIITSNQSGVFQLHSLNIASGILKQITYTPTGKIFGMLSADGRYIFYLRDESGNEIGHFVRVPFDGGTEEDLTPDLPAYSSFFIGTSRDAKSIGLMAANKDGYHFYIINQQINGFSTPKLLTQTQQLSIGPMLSADGKIAIIQTTERSGTLSYDLEAYNVDLMQPINQLSDGGDYSIQMISFSPIFEDPRVLATTNISGFTRPLLWNPLNGERYDFEFLELTGDVIPMDWSNDGRCLLLKNLNRAEFQLYTYELLTKNLTKLDHPSGSYDAGYFTLHRNIMVLHSDAIHPPQLLLLDGKSGNQESVIMSSGDVPIGRSFSSINFSSIDGAMVQAWLATPSDKEGPFPTIIHMHGGPIAVMTDRFHPVAQAWLDLGFAFCSVNYRGSITFGQDFEKKIRGNVGHWEVEDIVAAYHYLVNTGIAQATEVLLTGSSYGGYLTLQILGKIPELWAGGMGEVAVADWSMTYENGADALRGYIFALFGGTPAERSEAYRLASPITYAEQIKAPLMVIQGANDTRCPAQQFKAYETKLKSLGKNIEVLWFDAGHGAFSIDKQVQHMEKMLSFASKIVSKNNQSVNRPKI